MRQAGRFMAVYRKLRERYTLLEMFKTPEIAAAVTLQPITIFELDAAIIFADILLPLEGMGIRLEFAEKEGPRIHNPVQTASDVSALQTPDPEEDLGYLLRAIRLVRAEIDGRIPLIGFAGAPFTLASYAIEGAARSFLRTKGMMYENPELWRQLMEKLARVVTSLLLAQARAGAQAVQLFDSWAGYLSPADYRDYVLPYMKGVFQALKDARVLSIHFGTGTADLLPLMRAAGGDVIGVDWRTHIDDAWRASAQGSESREISTLSHLWLPGECCWSGPGRSSAASEAVPDTSSIWATASFLPRRRIPCKPSSILSTSTRCRTEPRNTRRGIASPQESQSSLSCAGAHSTTLEKLMLSGW